MILADVNVLIYAYRRDSPKHDVCKPWLDRIVSGDSQFGVSPLVLSAVVRITSNPRVFAQPSSTQEALSFCDSLLTQPHCEVIRPGDRHWEIFSQLCLDAGIRGPRITDAWLAALAIERGCTWITFDRDYARFPGLDWQEPQAG